LANIHPTAIVQQGASISPTATVGAYTTIGKDVTIDDGTTVAQFCVLDGNTTIGQNNQIFSHSVLGTIPQDLKFGGEISKLTIGDNNKIREHTLINTGTKGSKNSTTAIGSGNLIMAHSHIGHDCVLGDNIVIANSCAIA
jgi:UDP-N-acetylglucosamine acyltransferase